LLSERPRNTLIVPIEKVTWMKIVDDKPRDGIVVPEFVILLKRAYAFSHRSYSL
jgi:hypothetical protein